MSDRQDGDIEIDVARLAAAVWERRLAVGSLVILACMIAFAIVSTIQPRFRAETQILIEDRSPVFGGEGAADGLRNQYLDEQGVASQVEILGSSDLIKAVTTRLDLASHPEFSSAATPSVLGRVLNLIGWRANRYDAPPEERLVEEFREHLNIYQVASSRVIVVQFWSVDGDLSAQVANTIAEIYLEIQSGAKQVSNADTSAWLEPEIEQLRQKVLEAESKVAAFRAETGLLLVDENETLITQQLGDITTELARVRAEKADAQARAETVRNAIGRGESTEEFSNVMDSVQIQRLRERQAATESELADLSTTLLDRHPRIRALRSQLIDIQRQIKSETGKILNSLENEAEVARLRELELVKQLEELKRNSAEAGGKEVELRALEREAAAQRQLLETYLGRYREASSRLDPASLPADARIISKAFAPAKPYFPKIVATLVAAGFATLILSSITIMLMELFGGSGLRRNDANKEANRDSLEPETHPVIMLPSSEGAVQVREATDDPVPEVDTIVAAEPGDEPQSEDDVERSGDTLNDKHFEAGQNAANENDLRVAAEAAASGVAVTGHQHSVNGIAEHLTACRSPLAVIISPEGDRGSTSSVMLARLLANGGRQILLVDLTGSACPTRMMAMDNDLAGITNALIGDCSLADSIHADRFSSAHIMGQGTADPAEAMSHFNRLPDIVEALTQVYDIVVVECGPADSGGIARLLQGRDVDLILSLVHPDDELMNEYLSDFQAHGYGNIILMSPGAPNPPENPGRNAA